MFIVDRVGTFDSYCRGGTIGGRFVFGLLRQMLLFKFWMATNCT
jgi:hypothetical protein